MLQLPKIRISNNILYPFLQTHQIQLYIIMRWILDFIEGKASYAHSTLTKVNTTFCSFLTVYFIIYADNPLEILFCSYSYIYVEYF